MRTVRRRLVAVIYGTDLAWFVWFAALPFAMNAVFGFPGYWVALACMTFLRMVAHCSRVRAVAIRPFNKRQTGNTPCKI